MRAWAEETNRHNREHRASGASDRKELAAIGKKIASMISAIVDSGYVRGISGCLRELEAHQDEIGARVSTVPADLPDIHLNVRAIYRRKVARLLEVLKRTDERAEAVTAIRGLIERIELTPARSGARSTRRCATTSPPSSNGRETAAVRAVPARPARACRSRQSGDTRVLSCWGRGDADLASVRPKGSGRQRIGRNHTTSAACAVRIMVAAHLGGAGRPRLRVSPRCDSARARQLQRTAQTRGDRHRRHERAVRM